MPPRKTEDNLSSLERAREALYIPNRKEEETEYESEPEAHTIPHRWRSALNKVPQLKAHHVRFASIFLGIAVLFFLIALGGAAYLFYFGGNSVSPDKISVAITGPTTIAGGDTVPLSLAITNKNPVAIDDASIEIDFPEGTRNADDPLAPYIRYTQELGTLESGETITQSVKAILFGAAGQTVTLPITISYGTASSNSTFEKKLSYAITISSTPLSVSVDSLTETVSGAPVSFTLSVRSNATVPLDNVVLAVATPFGFSATSSSVPFTNSGFSLGTLAPGATKQITLTGTLVGQDGEQRVFHFSVGTAKSAKDSSIGVSYMTQDASISIAAPFIITKLSLNGDSSNAAVLAPGSPQNATLTYTNTLSTSVTDTTITVMLTGSAIDYDSIRSSSGFYNSATHSIVFSKDTDPALASLAPGASGIGTFTFSTLPVGTRSPSIAFSITASGTRVGQTNVPEEVTTSNAQTAKIATRVALSSSSSHVGGAAQPVPNQSTDYIVTWTAQDQGNAVTGAVVTATLPSYVTYSDATSGTGKFTYDSTSRTLTWNIGDLPQGGIAQGSFEISFLPSTSQSGTAVPFTTNLSFIGHDRFAGVDVRASADPATTESVGDPGYIPQDGVVR
jgi:hypothetical protein